MPSSRTKRWITIAAPFVALLGLEAGLRLAGFEQRADQMPVFVWNGQEPDQFGTEVLHRLDEWSLWAPRPGALVGRQSSERINADGFRGPELPPERQPDTLRVVLLGESSIYGVGVPWDKTCAPRLTELLAARQVPAQVVNAGVSGFTLLQGLERYRSAVRPLRPDVVCAAFGVANESSTCQGLSDLDKIVIARQHRSGSHETWDLLRRHVRVIQLVDWMRMRGQSGELRELLEEREQERVGGFEAMGQLDWPGCRRVPLDAFEAALEELNAEVQADGARLILISLPRMPDMEQRMPVQSKYSQSIEDVALRLNLRLIDMRGWLRKAIAGGFDPATLFLPVDVVHLGSEGQTLLALLLAEAIAPSR